MGPPGTAVAGRPAAIAPVGDPPPVLFGADFARVVAAVVRHGLGVQRDRRACSAALEALARRVRSACEAAVAGATLAAFSEAVAALADPAAKPAAATYLRTATAALAAPAAIPTTTVAAQPAATMVDGVQWRRLTAQLAPKTNAVVTALAAGDSCAAHAAAAVADVTTLSSDPLVADWIRAVAAETEALFLADSSAAAAAAGAKRARDEGAEHAACGALLAAGGALLRAEGAPPLREVAESCQVAVNAAATTAPLRTSAAVSAATAPLLERKQAVNVAALLPAAAPAAAAGRAATRLSLDVMFTNADVVGRGARPGAALPLHDYCFLRVVAPAPAAGGGAAAAATAEVLPVVMPAEAHRVRPGCFFATVTVTVPAGVKAEANALCSIVVARRDGPVVAADGRALPCRCDAEMAVVVVGGTRFARLAPALRQL